MKPLLEQFYVHFPRFKNHDQHDVQEAVLCIIDILERARPQIKDWFYGKKTQETVWPGGKSSSEEDFGIHLVTSRGTDLGEMLVTFRKIPVPRRLLLQRRGGKGEGDI